MVSIEPQLRIAGRWFLRVDEAWGGSLRSKARSLLFGFLKFGLCLGLLLWIAHTIFLQEAASRLGATEAWSTYSPMERARIAWSEGPVELWALLTSVGFLRFSAGFFCVGVTAALGIWRWSWLLGALGIPLSLGKAVQISMAGYFFNAFFFGSTGGDLARAYYTSKLPESKASQAVVSVISDRAVGLFSMLVFACVMSLYNWRIVSGSPALMGLMGFVWLALLGGLALGAVVVSDSIGGVVRRVMARAPVADRVFATSVQFRELSRRPRLLAKTLGLSSLVSLFCAIQIDILQRGLGASVPFEFLLFVVPAIICVSAIPLTPSGLGVRENLYVYALTAAPLGITGEQSLTVALLAYAGVLLWSAVGSIFYLSIRRSGT